MYIQISLEALQPAKFGYLLSFSPGGKIRFEENRVLEKRFSPERKWGGRADMEPRSAF